MPKSLNNLIPLGDFAGIFPGAPTKNVTDVNGADCYRVLTVAALMPGGLVMNTPISVRVLCKLTDKYRVKTGDVLISARSTSLLAGVVPAELDGMPFNSTLLCVRCLPTFEPRLLAAYINHPDGQSALLALAQSATAQLNITARALRNLPVPVPPMAEQKRLVELLHASDEAVVCARQAAEERHRLATEAVMKSMGTKYRN